MLSWFVYNFPFLSEIEQSVRTPCRPNFKPTRRQSGIKSNRQVKWAARIPPNKLPASCHLVSKILTSLFYLPLFLNHLGRKVFNSLLKSCFLLRRNAAAEVEHLNALLQMYFRMLPFSISKYIGTFVGGHGRKALYPGPRHDPS